MRIGFFAGMNGKPVKASEQVALIGEQCLAYTVAAQMSGVATVLAKWTRAAR